MVRVLITNDDGPPTGTEGSSPYVYPFARAIAKNLGWEVRVVVPSSQKSWVGKSYQISETIGGSYYYPAGEHGHEGETLELPRATKDGEDPPWILLHATPATCSNLALHGLYPKESFDLVIAGPNFGRNTSTAFALSSGTIGAAMAASLSGLPAIALSFGLMADYKPPGDAIVAGAIEASCKVVKQLYELGWSEANVDLYNVNVPLLPTMLSEEGPKVEWTTMARTGYNRLFKSVAEKPAAGGTVDKGGPAAVPEDANVKHDEEDSKTCLEIMEEHQTAPLKFIFKPDLESLLSRKIAAETAGCDTHALNSGAISVTPIRAGFESASPPSHVWKL
ncbi:tubulin-tyrosine ligase [Pseudohyphozyma bogoriensis]|nr:tubulin-tyrosine ligase [Pseudohyphozyma bogoriensis]